MDVGGGGGIERRGGLPKWRGVHREEHAHSCRERDRQQCRKELEQPVRRTVGLQDRSKRTGQRQGCTDHEQQMGGAEQRGQADLDAEHLVPEQITEATECEQPQTDKAEPVTWSDRVDPPLPRPMPTRDLPDRSRRRAGESCVEHTVPWCEEPIRTLDRVRPTVKEQSHDHPDAERYEHHLLAKAHRSSNRAMSGTRRSESIGHGRSSFGLPTVPPGGIGGQASVGQRNGGVASGQPWGSSRLRPTVRA